MLDKAIEHNKEHRKPYYGTKAYDRTCRNHGGCPCCKDNRLYRSNKLLEKSEQELEDFPDEIDFKPDWEKVDVTLEVTKVSKFKLDIDLIDFDNKELNN